MDKQGNSNRWSVGQGFLYYMFLKLKSQEFESYSSRKRAKVFDYFSHLIGTRTRIQVKTHHQKLMARHKTVQNYIDYYEAENINKITQYQETYITPKIQNVVRLSKKRSELKVESKQSTLSISSCQNTDNTDDVQESLLQFNKSKVFVEEKPQVQEPDDYFSPDSSLWSFPITLS